MIGQFFGGFKASPARPCDAGMMVALLAWALCGLAGCVERPQPDPGVSHGTAVEPAAAKPNRQFVFVPRMESLDFGYENGELSDAHSILESLGGGPAMLDYDGDGLLDLFFTGGGDFPDQKSLRGLPSLLLRNEGSWSFSPVTEEAGARADRPALSTLISF